MRIYKTEEFVKLPDGTVFGMDAGIFVKVQSLPPLDFRYLCLTNFEAASISERFARLAAMRDHGASFPLSSANIRHDTSDPDECFLVYETEDLCCMSKWFAAARVIHRDHETREQVA